MGESEMMIAAGAALSAFSGRSQHNRLMRLDFPFEDGPSALLLPNKLVAHEDVSRGFRFVVEVLSDDPRIPLKIVMGKMATISLVRQDGSLRYFNGYVTEFRFLRSDGGFAFFRIVLEPWLAFTRLCRDCVSFHHKSVREITEETLKHYPQADWTMHTFEEDPRLMAANQYNETDYNRLHRRWEALGLHYWYEHRFDDHKLMLSHTRRRQLRFIGPADRWRAAASHVRLRIWSLSSFLLLMFALWGSSPVRASTCFGTISKGHLTGGVQLPLRGDNFVAYSLIGVKMGRTYLHSLAHRVVLDAYTELKRTAPDKTYVYGETGFAHGGTISPHRTHQNGTSVDFMVPVMDEANQSIPLPSLPSNRFGYGLEFDDQGRMPSIRIDFDAMAEHLYQLSIAARRHNVTIERVIFDPPLTEKLFSSRRGGAELPRILPFMKARSWIRHDEHYHVDFGIPCRPLSEYREN